MLYSLRFRSCVAAALCLLTLPPIASAQQAAAGSAAPSAPLEGWLTILWGDSPGTGGHAFEETHRKILLADESGATTELAISDELLRGGVFRWNGKRVGVFPRVGAEKLADGRLPVAAIRLEEGAENRGGGVTGSQPWVSLLCKYSDIADEPRNLAFFEGMYANQPAGLDHYWREVSDDSIDIVGSTAVDWLTLPGTQTSYVPTPGLGTTANLGAVFEDCTAAADPFVDFSRGGSPYAGINIMINELLDCCAWGGGRFATLDGVSKVWRTTWNPPWAFNSEGVIAHEMGHGFGLPHANNFDGDDNPYDSPWDVMSAATSNAVNDSTYGRLGKHVNAYHKDRLGWFPAAQRFEVSDDSSTTIVLDHTALANATNYKIAVIPISGSRWYTVEARVRSGDYELNLAGDAVIIHEVDTTRGEPSWAVDGANPPANFGDNAGTMWTVGETFTDDVNDISVRVDGATADGFSVTLTRGDAGKVFCDGFESGGTAEWSSSQP